MRRVPTNFARSAALVRKQQPRVQHNTALLLRRDVLSVTKRSVYYNTPVRMNIAYHHRHYERFRRLIKVTFSTGATSPLNSELPDLDSTSPNQVPTTQPLPKISISGEHSDLIERIHKLLAAQNVVEAFDELKQYQDKQNAPLPVVIYNQILLCALRRRNVTLVADVFALLRKWRIEYDRMTFQCKIQWLVQTKQEQEKIETLWQIVKKKPKYLITKFSIEAMLYFAASYAVDEAIVQDVLDTAQRIGANLTRQAHYYLVYYYWKVKKLDKAVTAFQNYMTQLEAGQTFTHFWLLALGLRLALAGRLDYGPAELGKLVSYLMKCDRHVTAPMWRETLRSLMQTPHIHLFRELLQHIITDRKVDHTHILAYYHCICLLNFASEVDYSITLLTGLEPNKGQLPSAYPPRVAVYTETNKLIDMITNTNVKLSNGGCNLIMFSLTISKNSGVLDNVLDSILNKRLLWSPELKRNLYGYIASVIENCRSVAKNPSLIDTFEEIMHNILRTFNRGVRALLTKLVLLLAYLLMPHSPQYQPAHTKDLLLTTLLVTAVNLKAQLDISTLSVIVNELDRPYCLAALIVALEWTQSNLDDLLQLVTKYFPDYEYEPPLYQIYFTTCMFDAVKSGAFTGESIETAMRETMKQALDACKKRFGNVKSSICRHWTQLLAANENYDELRIAIDAIMELKFMFSDYDTCDPAISEYWHDAVSALIKMNRENEAKELLEEMKRKGILNQSHSLA